MSGRNFFVKCPQCAARTKVTERGLQFQPLVQCRCGASYMPQARTAAPPGAVVTLDADGVESDVRLPPKRLVVELA